MRALLSKVMTGSMVAGAALMVAACGGGGDEVVNNEVDVNLTEVEMGNDTTVMESTNGTDAMNMSTEATNEAENAAEAAGNAATNGM